MGAQILIFVSLFSSLLCALNVELSVKECAGVGSSGYPITTVVPLAKGAFQDLSKFRLTDASGSTVPAQIDVLNRRWAGDNSIANLQVTYMPVVSAFTATGTGIAKYYLKDDGPVTHSGASVALTETSSEITVTTGPLKFIVKKNGFNILDQVWFDKNGNNSYTLDELVVKSNSHNGGQLIGRLLGDTTFQQLGPSQYDADRSDVTYEIEKRGPVEVVIRAEAVTKYYSPSNHTHGWAVRIYAYAGKPYIKIDYQLQNSAKTKQYAWPLYFHAMDLNFDLNLGGNVTVRSGLGNGTVYSGSKGNGKMLAQRKDSLFNVYDVDGAGDTTTVSATGERPEGFLDMDDGSVGVTAITRNFWRMWPNGLKIDANNMLSVQLFPVWAANVNAATKNPVFNKTHLYWLQDMQHVYKEVMLNFHSTGVSDNDLINLAKTVNFHPVATLPIAEVRTAGASLDLEGFIPQMNKISTTDSRTPSELASAKLGWNYYLLHGRRYGTSEVGGTPFGGAQFWATENPSDWFVSERDIIGELNTRPEWLAQYNHARDFSTLLLGTNMSGEAPPRFDPHSLRAEVLGADMFDSAMIAATATGGNYTYDYVSSIDNSHLWRYHVADGYWITGNPWLKDFYKFQAEYRKCWLEPSRLKEGTIKFAREIAHPWAEAFQAYKVTGDTSLVRMMVKDVEFAIRPSKKQYGGNGPAWHLGFFMRPLVDLMYEIRETNPQGWAEIFQAVSGGIDCNITYSNFTYDEAPPIFGKSYYGSYTLLDPQAWYYWYTGKKDVLVHLNTYVDWGINGGTRPMYTDGIDYAWKGDYSGRWIQLTRNRSKTDSIPPAAITDLKLSRTGNQCTLEWTGPAQARKYHVIWSGKLITQVSSSDAGRYCNWWAANVIGPSFSATPGGKEQLTFTVTDTSAHMLNAAVYSWDSSWNMSEISNIARQDITPATAPANFTARVLDANHVDLSWSAASDPESGIWYYILYRDGIKIAEIDSPKYADQNLKASTAYTYEVAAFTGAGVEGLRSSVVATTIADTARPYVQQIISVSLKPEIFLYFSERMDKASVENIGNYGLNSGRKVQDAQLLPDLRGVVLTCDSLEFGQSYQLTLNDLKDLAATQNSITQNTQIAFVHREPLKLDSLVNVYKSNVPNFLFDTCRVGKTPFTDWAMPIATVPQKYVDLPMLMTACNDNAIIANNDPYITFNTNKAIRLYVALDDRQPKPSWLTSSFTNTGEDITLVNSSSSAPFPVSLYVSNATYPAGKVGIKGLAGNIAYANYFFLVEPMDSSWFVLPSQPAPEPLAERIVWNFDSTTEGWVPNDCPVPKVVDGVMKVNCWWAMIYSPESLKVNTAKYDYLKIVMRNRSTDSSATFAFWTSNKFASENVLPKLAFRTVPSDSIFRTYILDLRPARNGKAWSGIMQRFRLQFITHTGTTNNDSIEIDKIELIPDTVVPVAVEDPIRIPEFPELVQVYPNPFNPRVNVVVQCRTQGLKNQPIAAIYNIQGRLVARLTPVGIRSAGQTGRFEYVWEGDRNASGAYVVMVRAGSKTYKRMALLLK